mmetsp:Transcript_28444/g.51291  ORF Transcript_28444/g.51291 Transcript_28444/m.51291 type:complete len:228 (+) Transcript_28444:218-901(+)
MGKKTENWRNFRRYVWGECRLQCLQQKGFERISLPNIRWDTSNVPWHCVLGTSVVVWSSGNAKVVDSESGDLASGFARLHHVSYLHHNCSECWRNVLCPHRQSRGADVHRWGQRCNGPVLPLAGVRHPGARGGRRGPGLPEGAELQLVGLPQRRAGQPRRRAQERAGQAAHGPGRGREHGRQEPERGAAADDERHAVPVHPGDRGEAAGARVAERPGGRLPPGQAAI